MASIEIDRRTKGPITWHTWSRCLCLEKAERKYLEPIQEPILPGICLPEDRLHLVRGDLRRVAPSFVGEQAIGLVVIGTLCRSGIRGMLIGNTAESILSSLSCDVLTVEPKGFVSPVGLPDEERSSGPQD